MFYRKEDVDEAIICGICNSIYKSPRVLPCSESACHECIQFIIQTDPNQEFACNFCHEKHTPLGKDGFPVNGALMKLLKAKAGTVCRSAKVEELKHKLLDIKSKCSEFKMNLDNGVDQISQHCIRLRNRVHLETDILIEEAHTLNKSLIAEINKYEEECIKSFNSNTSKTDNKFNKFVDELNEFHSDKTKYLSDFKIDEKTVVETIKKADSHLEKLKIEDRLLMNIQFSGKVAEFIKRSNEIDRTLLGTLVFKSLSLDENNLTEIEFSNDIFATCSSSIHSFNHNNSNNFIFFYIDTNRHLQMICFDNGEQVKNGVVNALNYVGCGAYSEIIQLNVTHSLNSFIFYVKLPVYAQGSIRGRRQLHDNQAVIGLFFILDYNLNYVNHNASFGTHHFLHIAASRSRVICIDSSNNFFLLDMNLNLVYEIRLSLDKIKNQVENTIVEVQMNDQYVFLLCNWRSNSNQLKIFEISSGNLVKEMKTNANKVKLVSRDRLVLFDNFSRIIYLYEQTGEFCKLEEINLAQSLNNT
jgi:hypothetical protein